MRRIAVLLASGLMMLIATPAGAHADFVSMDPSPGSVVTSLDVITLSFSEDITALGSVVVVLDPAGEALQAGMTVQGRQVLVPVNAPTRAGVHYVNYRVVSVDSHVIEGSQQLTVDLPTLIATQGTDPAVVPAPRGEAASAESRGVSVVGIGLIVLIVVGAILYALSVRKGRK